MQGLLRFAGWGVAATAALLLVVIAANSSSGQQRLSAAFADVNGARAAEAAKAEAAQAAQFARIAATEDDTRRLIELVRSLAADRERLTARLTVLERNLEDVTGAFQRQAAATPPAATPPASASPGGLPAPTAPPQSAPPTTAAGAGAEPEPPNPNRLASVTPSGSLPELETVEGRQAAGVDLGSAPNFDGLRTLWASITSAHGGLFEGLHPIVVVRENSRSRTADLRLVAGPLTNVEYASRICATLAAAKHYCRLVAFAGQPLALNAPPAPPPRRPQAAAPKPRPTAKAP